MKAGGNANDAGSWSKSGPIFDHHAAVYGPGSVVFTPSVDDSEYLSFLRSRKRVREERRLGREEEKNLGRGEAEEDRSWGHMLTLSFTHRDTG